MNNVHSLQSPIMKVQLKVFILNKVLWKCVHPLKFFLLSAMIQLFYLTENLIFRGVESSGKSPLDLCILVLREVNNAHVAVGNLITHSPRQLRCFVGCNVMLEAGEYVVIPLAFNNWNISKWLPVCYCEHTELFFSSTLRL